MGIKICHTNFDYDQKDLIKTFQPKNLKKMVYFRHPHKSILRISCILYSIAIATLVYIQLHLRGEYLKRT